MKRTPLSRSSSGLKRGKRRPRPSLAGFWAEVTQEGTSGCALAYLGGCGGKLDAHHVYPAQRLRRLVVPELRDAAVQDARNGLPCCREHHNMIEGKRIACPHPPYLTEFLDDYNISERGL